MRPGSMILCFVLTSLTGCAAILGFDDFVAGTKSEEPSDSGPSAVAEAEWYVSPLGADENDGSREHPVRSLRQAALLADGALARDASAVQRIAVCAGEYPEAGLELRGALEIRGGYECTSWRRPAADEAKIGASFESPSKLVGTDSGEAFIVLRNGPGTSRAPHLDGLTIVGNGVSAVVVVLGAAQLTELSITNGTIPAVDAGGPTLISAVATLEANARIERCSLVVKQNGVVTAREAAIAGILVSQSALVLRRNRIVVDRVAGTCHGVLSTGARSLEIAENFVELTNCIGVDDRLAAIGVLAIDSVAKSVRNTFKIEAPGNVDPTKPAILEGIDVRERGSLVSDGDRVIGPTALQPASNAAGGIFYGFRGNGALERVTNASIVLDSHQYGVKSSAGVFLYEPSSTLLAHTSMYFSTAGSDAGGTPPMRGIYLNDEAIGADGGASALTVESNLIVTDDSRTGLLRASCSLSAIAKLAHNRYAGFAVPVAGRDCTTGQIDEVPTNAPDDDNVAITCPSGGCINLFEMGVDVVPATRTGLSLAPSTACGLPLGVPANADIASDGAGRPRGTGSTTVGAFLLGCN